LEKALNYVLDQERGGKYKKKSIAMATERFRRNTIAMLKDSQCNEIADPYQMAGMLWNSYKDHMGHFEGISMQFDLQVLLNKVDGLDDLTLPFQEKRNK
jgi:hypothetical protein